MKKSITVSALLLLLSAVFIASLQAETETIDQLQTETGALLESGKEHHADPIH